MKNLIKTKVAKMQRSRYSNLLLLNLAAGVVCWAETVKEMRAKARNKRFFFMMSDTVYDEYLINTSLLKMRNKGKHFCLPSIYILLFALIT